MSKITEISEQKRDKTRVNLYLDGTFYCGLSLETVYRYRIKTGMETTEAEIAEMQLESEKTEAFDKSLTYVSKALKPKKAVKEYLYRKGYTDAVVKYCIDKLAEYGFVDDYAYCSAYVRTYRGSKGKKLIERDLKLKGIDFNLVEKALSEGIDSQEDAVKAIAIKYMRGKEPTKENSAKLYKYILSKGFGYDEAAYAVKVVKGELWNEY